MRSIFDSTLPLCYMLLVCAFTKTMYRVEVCITSLTWLIICAGPGKQGMVSGKDKCGVQFVKRLVTLTISRYAHRSQETVRQRSQCHMYADLSDSCVNDICSAPLSLSTAEKAVRRCMC